MKIRRVGYALALLVGLAVSGCGKKEPAEPPTNPDPKPKTLDTSGDAPPIKAPE